MRTVDHFETIGFCRKRQFEIYLRFVRRVCVCVCVCMYGWVGRCVRMYVGEWVCMCVYMSVCAVVGEWCWLCRGNIYPLRMRVEKATNLTRRIGLLKTFKCSQ